MPRERSDAGVGRGVCPVGEHCFACFPKYGADREVGPYHDAPDSFTRR
jgi:hypothetical protein